MATAVQQAPPSRRTNARLQPTEIMDPFDAHSTIAQEEAAVRAMMAKHEFKPDDEGYGFVGVVAFNRLMVRLREHERAAQGAFVFPLSPEQEGGL